MLIVSALLLGLFKPSSITGSYIYFIITRFSVFFKHYFHRPFHSPGCFTVPDIPLVILTSPDSVVRLYSSTSAKYNKPVVANPNQLQDYYHHPTPFFPTGFNYSSSEKPRAQERFLKIKTLDLEVSKTLERGRAKN